tara:strand:- start:2380 stop:3774 length:1395 start_codon:yes stop_codon:yes gene_type:complete
MVNSLLSCSVRGLLPLLLIFLGGLSVPAIAGNVILIIGDGMDDSQITIARNYLVGSRSKLLVDKLPLRSAVQVLTVDEDNPQQPLYVADSANSATSIATGAITSPGRIGTTAASDKDLINLVELVKQHSIKVGLVTTASITDATPASFYAHVNDRGCENPSAMVDFEKYAGLIVDCSQDLKANGGLGSISEQLIISGVDVALGGGMNHFTPDAEGSTLSVLALAKEAGYTVIENADQLAGNHGGKLLGLFSPSTMPVRWYGEDGRTAEKPKTSFMNLFHPMLGSVTYPEPMICEDNPDYAGMPSLASMSEVALAELTNDAQTPFFLMIESASIDKQAHERKACGSIGELQQLDEALAVALKFADTNPDTLILVTADHGHAAQILSERTIYDVLDLPIHSPGQVARITTPEGAVMTVNYATNNFVSEEHTGVNVPLLSNSVGVGKIPGMITQPEIFNIIKDYLID